MTTPSPNPASSAKLCSAASSTSSTYTRPKMASIDPPTRPTANPILTAFRTGSPRISRQPSRISVQILRSSSLSASIGRDCAGSCERRRTGTVIDQTSNADTTKVPESKKKPAVVPSPLSASKIHMSNTASGIVPYVATTESVLAVGRCFEGSRLGTIASLDGIHNNVNASRTKFSRINCQT